MKNQTCRLPHTAVVMLAFVFVCLVTSLAMAADFVSIDRNIVNIRERPTTDSARQWELSRGYPLQVEQREGGWLKVRDYEETLGWVLESLTSKRAHRVVTATNVNLRSGPAANTRRLGKLDQDEIVQTLENQGEWTKIKRSNGTVGWVAKRFTWGW